MADVPALTPQQPFMGAIPVSQQPTYPVQQVSAPAGGLSGGLVNKYAQVQAAVQGAQNQQNQQAQMDRAATEFKEQQAASQAKGNVGTPETPAAIPPGEHSATGDGHADFMGAVLQGLHSLGSGVSRIFGGGQPAPAVPMPQQGTPQAAIPVPAAAPQQLMKGGPVHGSPPAPAFLQGPTTGDPGPHSTILAFQDGGAVPAYGVVDGGVKGLRGFDQGGAIPQQGPPAPDAAAPQQGPPAPVAAQQGPPAGAPVSPEHAHQEMTKAIVDAHQILHDHTLNDNDVPNNAQAIPTAAGDAQAPASTPGSASPATSPPTAPGSQASPAAQAGAPGSADPQVAQAKVGAAQAAVQNVATNQDAQAGDPGPATQKHSITPAQWDAFEQRKEYAIKMAAYAGQDPGQVRAAMDANRNAWVQGGVLKYLATANAAALKGDQSAVQAALHNAYYYLPDGNQLTFDKKGPDGQLRYQDPVNPYIDGKTGAPASGPNAPGAQPNMVPVDSRHIQMLGTAMLDPMNVQTTINNVRTAQSKIGLQYQQGMAARDVGTGRKLMGEGSVLRAEAEQARVPSENWKNTASGQADLIRANAIQAHLANLAHATGASSTLLKGANGASQYFNNLAQGQEVTDQHATDASGLPNPNFGRPTRDPTKVPPELKDASPGDVADGAAMAGKIYMGAGGQIPVAEAARLATLYTQQKRSTRAGPSGKQAGVMYDTATGDTHVWNPKLKKWEAFKLPTGGAAPPTAGISNTDVDPVALSAMNQGDSGQSGVPAPATTPSDESNPAEESVLHDDQAGG